MRSDQGLAIVRSLPPNSNGKGNRHGNWKPLRNDGNSEGNGAEKDVVETRTTKQHKAAQYENRNRNRNSDLSREALHALTKSRLCRLRA